VLLEELNSRCNAIEQAERDGDFELANELKIQFNEKINENLSDRLREKRNRK